MKNDSIRTPKLEQMIKEHKQYWAHIPTNNEEGREAELLEDHTALVFQYASKIIKEKEIQRCFRTMLEMIPVILSANTIQLIEEMFYSVFVFHDIGKINPNFQIERLHNDQLKIEFSKEESKLLPSLSTKHSLLSSLIYINYYRVKVAELEGKERKIARVFMYLNAYVIERHHSDLDSFERYLQRLNDTGVRVSDVMRVLAQSMLYDDWNLKEEYIEKDIRNITKYYESAIYNWTKEQQIILYTYTRLVYSLLLAGDYYATFEYSTQREVKDIGNINDFKEFSKVYYSQQRYQRIEEYKKQVENKGNITENLAPINILRNELFLEAENQLLNNLDYNIFYLEAPTGSGKSNTAMNLVYRLMENNPTLHKVFMIYPYNTLVEQNKEILEEMYQNQSVLDKIAVVNSVTPIKQTNHMRVSEDSNKKNAIVEEESNAELYGIDLLNRQFLNYPFILMSSVGLFDVIFGTKQSNVFSFQQLANSVIVLDEIQSYRNQIWNEMIQFFSVYSKILNIKVIIMSATLPDLNIFLEDKTLTKRLIIDREKYFLSPVFKDRVQLNYELMNSTDIENDLQVAVLDHIGEKKKILVEFISKKTAFQFYSSLVEQIQTDEQGVEVLLLSGDDNAIERKRILQKIKMAENKTIILVATQVIEAGVDIDMDLGFKDTSILDSEEQFLGRINRSCFRAGIAYFFHWDQVRSIYHGDVRNNAEFTLQNDSMKQILKEKNFSSYYSEIVNCITEKFNESADDKYNINKFLEDSVSKVNLLKVEERMKLIKDDDRTYTVCLARTLQDGVNIYNGAELWKEYKQLLQNVTMEYAEKQIKLSIVMSQLNYFLYKVRNINNLAYNDRVGDLLYVEDGEKYFLNGKLDREMLEGKGDIFFDIV